ncbi:hypothetical protein [Polaromonas sp.]|uniref:hypothetical protein n=1 Tax=Polaromonas sp. TaxID=1869339 RepID=UPI00356A84A2
MPRPHAPRNAGDSRPGQQGIPAPETNQPAPQNKGWPFAEGSQNHLDETSAPWPRPSSRSAPAKTPTKDTPGQ